jgi:hypothetical protein
LTAWNLIEELLQDERVDLSRSPWGSILLFHCC